MSAKRKRPSRELHDAFENDIDLDLAVEEAAVETAEPTQHETAPRGDQRDLIERVRPSEMIPDRFQPRPILPVDLHHRYFDGDLNCYEVAAEWLQLAEEDKGHRSRIAELVSMADSVDDHGQIKAITGSWITTEDGGYVFRIETGERRYWGACLKRVLKGAEDEPLLRVEAVDEPSVERQIVENRHAQPPTAVAQAREIAALLLKKMDIHPDPEHEDPYEFFRQALDPPGRQRLPRGIWDEIEPIMQVTQRRMRQILSVLRLPTELLEIADRYEVSDRVLQAILSEPEEEWPELLEVAISRDLTGDELSVAAAARRDETPKRKRKKKPDHARSALRGLRGFSGALSRAGDKDRSEVLDTVADEIVIQEDAANVVGVLEELVSLVRTRLSALEEE